MAVAGGSPNPNIIGARLRVAAMTPPSAHPDADLLTAFAEHCLNEPERAKILEHLAQCAVCRDVVYFAQPEDDAALKPVQAPVQTHWFAGRRLQWAALAASLSMIAAVAIFLRTNPERMAQYAPATTSPVANKEAQPQGNLQNEGAGATYGTSPAAQSAENPEAMRRESNLKAPEALQKAVPGGTGAGSVGKLSRDEADAAQAGFKGAATFDDKEAAKRGYEFNFERKDAKTETNAGTAGEVNGLVATNGSTAGDKDHLFDLRRQKVQGGPSANTSNANANQNKIQNQTNFDLDRNAESYNGNIPAPPPPSPAAKPDSVEMSQSSSAPASSTSASITSGTRSAPVQAQASAKPVAVTHGVVPAEEARKKKPETIPAQSTAQATEETVAVAGQAQEVDRISDAKISDQSVMAASSGQSARTSKNLPLNGRSATTLATLAPGAAGTSAITGWRIHRGRVQERLYGIWHNAVVGTQPTSNNSGTLGGLGLTQTPQLHFSGVTAMGANVWTVQAIGRGQSSLAVYHSRDVGVSWQPSILTAPGTLNPDAQVAIKFTDALHGEVTLSTGEKWQTSDGGAQWKFVK